MVAQFIEEKNHMWFLEHIAFNLIDKYKNLEFIFIGDGYSLSKCKDVVKQNHLESLLEISIMLMNCWQLQIYLKKKVYQ